MKQNTRHRSQITAAFAAASFVATTFGISTAAMAQLNTAEKHPTATGVAAGVATHHLLKKSAAHKKATGQKLNFAEKHPTLSAIGAAATTHHLLKKSAAHKKGH